MFYENMRIFKEFWHFMGIWDGFWGINVAYGKVYWFMKNYDTF